MTFLSPIPAIIAAAITIPLLIAFFLLKLRRRPRRVGSTMLWEQSVRDLQANVPFRWLRPSLLLLLALLILSLLLLAFARPAIEAGPGAGARTVLLIDRSMSMSAADAPGGRTRLEAARREAMNQISRWRRQGFDGEASVVAFAAEPRVLAPMTSDLALLESAIASIEPTDQPADAAAALALAGALLAPPATEEGEGAPGGHAILFSDGGFIQDQSLTIPGATARFVRVGPAADEPTTNAAIVALSARRDWEDPALLRVFLRAQNVSAAEVATTARLTIDGRPAATQPLVIPAAGERGPGDRALTFELVNLQGGLLGAEIDVTDALERDDRAALIVAPPRRPAIVLVRAEGIDDPARWVLDEILRGLEPRALSVYGEAEYERALGEGTLDAADLLIFDMVRPRALPAVPSIHLGAGLPSLELGGPSQRGTRVVRWLREHPILRHVSLDPVYVSEPLHLPEDAGLSPLAWGAEAPLMALGETAGARRLLVAFDLAESNWAMHFGFAIFVASAVDFLTEGEQESAESVATDQPLRVRPLAGGDEVVIRDAADGIVRRVRIPQNAGRTLTLAPIERAGVYEVQSALPPRIAVNAFLPLESAIPTRDSLTISGEAVAATPGEAASRRELWPWFVLAAMVLLLLEWLLYAWRMRV